MREEDDFGFIRNYLDRELAEKLSLFVWAKDDGEIKVAGRDINQLRDHPRRVQSTAHRASRSRLRPDGTLVLDHQHRTTDAGSTCAGRTRALKCHASLVAPAGKARNRGQRRPGRNPGGRQLISRDGGRWTTRSSLFQRRTLISLPWRA
jgi:hypothetical protein